eukprot:m.341277 g.341277  ORF g.341277 m.341277 type:complete len:236 (+) comp19978_c0_seq1:170-877(+)
MSRAHMIYAGPGNDLGSVDVVKWEGSWPYNDKEGLQKEGMGILAEGTLKGLPCRVIVEPSTGGKHRYILIQLNVERAFARQFENGKEIEVAIKDVKKVNTGYLNSSYKTVEGRSEKLPLDSIRKMNDAIINKLNQQRRQDPSVLSFMGDEDMMKQFDLTEGLKIRVKTMGNTPFIESAGVIDTASKVAAVNYAGGASVGESWTDKLQKKGAAAQADAGPLPGEELEGADDDEWDD